MKRLLKIIAVAVVAIVLGVLVGARVYAVRHEVYAAAEVALPTGRFIEVNGLQLYIQEKGPSTGRPVLFISGTLAWSETWRDTLDPLAEAGFRTIAVDLPPFGLSARPAPDQYGPVEAAKLITSLIDFLQINKVVLVGHSIGGGATVEAAFKNEQRLSGLVLVAGALGLAEAPRTHKNLPEKLLAWRPLRTVVTSATFANPLMLRPGLEAFVAKDFKVTEERESIYQRPLVVRQTSEAIGDWLVGDLFAYPKDAAFKDVARYASFKPPVLLVWGRDDTVTPLAQGEDLNKRFPGSRLEVIDGVNHIPHLEVPAKFNEILLGYLKALP